MKAICTTVIETIDKDLLADEKIFYPSDEEDQDNNSNNNSNTNTWATKMKEEKSTDEIRMIGFLVNM